MGWVLTARFVDRIGKGIRGAPRDALVGDLTPPALRGACFGLRQSLDTVGAFAGPILAVLLMSATGDDFRLVFWIAAVPAFVAVTLLIVGVREPDTIRVAREAHPSLRVSDLRGLGPAHWWLVIVASVLTLARFSEAFLLLRAQSVGLAVALVPLVLVAMNVMYALAAFPAGDLSDRIDRRRLVAVGALVLIASDILLARAAPLVSVMCFSGWFSGAFTWVSRRDCSVRSSSIRHRPVSGARRPGSSISRAERRCWSPVSSPGGSGRGTERRRPLRRRGVHARCVRRPGAAAQARMAWSTPSAIRRGRSPIPLTSASEPRGSTSMIFVRTVTGTPSRVSPRRIPSSGAVKAIAPISAIS
jgi:MFS family permease